MRRAQGIGHPHLLHHPNGWDIIGAGQGIAQRNRPMILAVVVLRAVKGAVILGESGGDIENHGGWRHPVFQRCQVDIGFETGTGLAVGRGNIDLAVDLFVVIVK